jgi:nucleotide-binding universal stress UspA family protein
MIKDIVVHLTGSDEDEVRLAHAEPIARTFNAHVTGLQVHPLPELFAIADPTAGVGVMDELIAESQQRAQAITEKLLARFTRFEAENDIKRIDAYPAGVGGSLAAATRTADLFIGTRPYGDPTGAEHIEEEVLFQSGRACLFIPPKGIPSRQYATILVAWKDSRESARAVAESLPFLQQAHQVVVAIVEDQGASEQYRIEAGADIGRYLSRHGVSAEIRKIGGWVYAGEAILNEAEQCSADLIVMGGYGHSRFREFVLGGTTRHVLAEARIPVLMAH